MKPIMNIKSLESCAGKEILLIIDEVQTGMEEPESCLPTSIMTYCRYYNFAKGLGGGYP